MKEQVKFIHYTLETQYQFLMYLNRLNKDRNFTNIDNNLDKAESTLYSASTLLLSLLKRGGIEQEKTIKDLILKIKKGYDELDKFFIPAIENYEQDLEEIKYYTRLIKRDLTRLER